MGNHSGRHVHRRGAMAVRASGIASSREHSDAAIARAFAGSKTAMTRLEGVESKPVYRVRLGGQSWIAKETIPEELARDRAAHDVASILGLGAYQPRMVAATRDGHPYLLTQEITGPTLRQIDFGQSFDAMKATLHAQPLSLLTRMMLYDYVIGDYDRSAQQFIYHAPQQRLYQLDHAAAFDYRAGFANRHALIPGIHEHPQGSASSGVPTWRSVEIPHAELRRVLDHMPQIRNAVVRTWQDRYGGHEHYFAARVRTLEHLNALPHPTFGDWAALAPTD